MERELWEQLYALAVELDKAWRNKLYRDSVIIGVLLWAAIHDRPISWACDERNWYIELDFHIPSQSTMSRRSRSADVILLFVAMEMYLSLEYQGDWVKVVDGKPLPVSGFSKDPDARWGHGAGGAAKGYKLHAIWGSGPLPLAWQVQPMNASESKIAQTLIPKLPCGGYLLGDKEYDTNPLHAVAAQYGHQLIAPQQRESEKLGHHRHHPGRLRALHLLKTTFGETLFKERDHIERKFGELTNFGAGLSPLPNWVRRLSRVRLWVYAKILINVIRFRNKQRSSPLALA
jgi:hypothetical protein